MFNYNELLRFNLLRGENKSCKCNGSILLSIIAYKAFVVGLLLGSKGSTSSSVS